MSSLSVREIITSHHIIYIEYDKIRIISAIAEMFTV